MEKEIENKEYKPIEVKALFADKNPRLARMIPGFAYRYLKRVLALDFTNELLKSHGHKKNLEFAKAVLVDFNVTVDVHGRENLPDGGRNIFVSNHPLGGFDGGIITRELGAKYENLNFLVNDILMNVTNMDGIFVPINKHGAQAMKNVRFIDTVYQSDNQVISFPAGLVSRRKKGVIEDLPWQKSFITKSVQYKRDVVVIHVSGRCSNFFYNLSSIRKFLGIKANLEMFYLPSETYKHRNNHYQITIGKSIPWETFDKSHRPIEWAEMLKKYCYQLSSDPNSKFSVK